MLLSLLGVQLETEQVPRGGPRQWQLQRGYNALVEYEQYVQGEIPAPMLPRLAGRAKS